MLSWRCAGAGSAAVFFMFLCVNSVIAAAVKLPELNGSWQGSGTDRATPLETAQHTHCRATIRASETSLNQEMTCVGDAGLRKTVRLAVHLSGNAISGTLTQTSVSRANETPATLHGSVSGSRTDNAANLRVNFGGIMPSVSVALNMNSASAFSLHASTFGGTLMQVSFSRTGR
jgi:hypothetical protein